MEISTSPLHWPGKVSPYHLSAQNWTFPATFSSMTEYGSLSISPYAKTQLDRLAILSREKAKEDETGLFCHLPPCLISDPWYPFPLLKSQEEKSQGIHHVKFGIKADRSSHICQGRLISSFHWETKNYCFIPWKLKCYTFIVHNNRENDGINHWLQK